MIAPARLLRGLAAALLLTLGLGACATERLPSLDTDPRAYPSSRSGESFAAVLREFDVALPAQATGVRYYVETNVDTRDLYLAFAVNPAQVPAFLSGFAQAGTTPVDLAHTDAGCSLLCTSSMPTAVPWHLASRGASVRSPEGNTKSGSTADFAIDEAAPSSWTVYLQVTSLGS